MRIEDLLINASDAEPVAAYARLFRSRDGSLPAPEDEL
jgi:hypothetical protein